MIAIVDYGVGNLFSLSHSFAALGAESVVTGDPALLRQADRIVFPGVGAYPDAAAKLQQRGLREPLIQEARAGKPFLGICLGMQLLFERGYEYGECQGMGLIPGSVRDIRGLLPADSQLKIPQIGWNALHFVGKPHPLFRQVKEGDCVYFVHSFAATDCADSLVATCEYGAELTAAVARDNVMGCQFHPEKSGKVGLSILRAFCEL